MPVVSGSVLGTVTDPESPAVLLGAASKQQPSC